MFPSDFSIALSLASDTASIGITGSLIRFLPPYSVEQHSAQPTTCHDVQSFISLQNHPRRLSVSHKHYSQDTVAGALRKRRKHWRGQIFIEFRTLMA